MAIPRAICLVLLWAISAVGADMTGLRQQSETKITARMAGAPFKGDYAPFIWALSFSPDGKTLATGVQFARRKELRNLHAVVWSSSGRFVAVTPWGDWDHAAIIYLEAGQLDVFRDRVGVPWCGAAAGLLPGLESCSNVRCKIARTRSSDFQTWMGPLRPNGSSLDT